MSAHGVVMAPSGFNHDTSFFAADGRAFGEEEKALHHGVYVLEKTRDSVV